MSKMGWFGVVRITQGHSKVIRWSMNEFLLAFHGNCVPILHRFCYSEILVENRRFNLPTSVWRPCWNFAKSFGNRKLESLRYRVALSL